MQRAKIIVANWKMHKTALEAQEFVKDLRVSNDPQVWIAPSFAAIAAASVVAKGVTIGAQNMHDAEGGAFTGEVSAAQLKEVGAKFVILGHSERRRLFGETDEFIHRKVARAIAHGLIPLLCVGETEEERAQGKTEEVLTRQLERCPDDLVVAYEPVWAIGTGKAATPEMAQETHAFIRSLLKEKTPILYGGSVTPETIAGLMQQPDIDGALVGGAALDLKTFTELVNNSRTI